MVVPGIRIEVAVAFWHLLFRTPVVQYGAATSTLYAHVSHGRPATIPPTLCDHWSTCE